MVSNILMHIITYNLELFADLLKVWLHQSTAVQTKVAQAVDSRCLLINSLEVKSNNLLLVFIRVQVELGTLLVISFHLDAKFSVS